MTGRRVIGIAPGGMVRGVKDRADFWNRSPNRRFDPLSQRHGRHATALAASPHAQVNVVLPDIDQFDESSVRCDSWIHVQVE